MPNTIKYKTGNLTGSLQKSNVALGVTSQGPTLTTGFYAGAGSPPSGKYFIYKVDVSNPPKLYAPASDTELINFVKNEGATGANTGSVAAALSWIATQTNLMAANIEYEGIVTDGLVLNLDAGFVGSYPTTGTSWYDISSNSKTVTLTNGPSFNANGGGGIVFDGADDYGNLGTIGGYTNKFSCEAWFKTTSSASWKNIICGGCGDIIFTINGNYVNFGSQCSSPIPHLNYSTTAVNSGAWFFASVTYDSGVAKVYVNGTLENTYTRSDASQTPGTVFVGANSTGTSEFFNGTIAVVRMYDRALSAAEITQNFNAQKGRFGL